MAITIQVLSADGEVRSEGRGDDLAMFDVRYSPFERGDVIRVACDEAPAELEVMFDKALYPSVVYLEKGELVFPVPFDTCRDAYGTQAFSGHTQWGYARRLDARERENYRNLALNSHDLEGTEGVYPHATTNSGATDVRFLARNAIDGTFQTCHHGYWPYGSWGINGRDDAWLQVDFGRPVWAEELVLWLRADFPHDAWWESARVTCSDGFEATMSLVRSGAPQRMGLDGGRWVEWVRISDLVKADDPSPWPALTQLMVMGRIAR